jgi:hypothetical protein
MSHKYHAQITRHFGIALAKALVQFLPVMLRTYYELRRRAKPGKKTVTIVLDELASSLGYDVAFVQGILEDLSRLDIIRYESGRNACKEQTVIILVI